MVTLKERYDSLSGTKRYEVNRISKILMADDSVKFRDWLVSDGYLKRTDGLVFKIGDSYLELRGAIWKTKALKCFGVCSRIDDALGGNYLWDCAYIEFSDEKGEVMVSSPSKQLIINNVLEEFLSWIKENEACWKGLWKFNENESCYENFSRVSLGSSWLLAAWVFAGWSTREDAQLVIDEMNERHPSRFASKPHPSTMIEIENRFLKESMKVGIPKPIGNLMCL